MKYQRVIKVAILAVGLLGFIACNNTAKKTDQGDNNSPEQMQQDRPQQRERPSVSDMIARMDTDKDGKLSKSEVKGRLLESFATIDTDEDGFITEEELEKAPRPEGRQRGERGEREEGQR